jgi:hypothetical protein
MLWYSVYIFYARFPEYPRRLDFDWRMADK